MDKAHILSEIKRTAKENDGKPLGSRRFQKETGIKPYDWGMCWDNWGSALKEAGFAPNTFVESYSSDVLIDKLIELIRELGRFPMTRQIIRKARQAPPYPDESTFRNTLGSKAQRVTKVIEYCRNRTGFEDVIKICSAVPSEEKPAEDKETQSLGQAGYVYLWKAHRRYKIGKSSDLDRRESELARQAPYKWQRIHEIKTDDPSGVEAYWHRRFKSKATDRNEWFELSSEDVKAFKRWKNVY